MARYSEIPQFEGEGQYKPKRSHSRLAFVLVALLAVLSISINAAISLQYQRSLGVETPPHGRHARTPEFDTVWSRFYWHTRWDAPNRTQSDLLWDRILPSHGFVAIDREQAASKGWPETMFFPSDESKGVYLIEAYHQLHCLKIIRQTFHEAVEHRPYTYDPHHAEHCFDALRQSAVCNADSTPLYTFGDKTAGDGQIHKCRSWEQLRAWTSENSACYRDSVKDVPLGDHFGFCDDGNDGIRADELVIN